MAAPDRRKRKKKVVVKTLVRVFFVLLEMQRILSGDSDQITEWVARDSYNYAAPNERIFVDVTGS